MIADVISGSIACSKSNSPRLIPPNQHDVLIQVDSSKRTRRPSLKTVKIEPFSISDQDFPLCGFSKYEISAKDK